MRRISLRPRTRRIAYVLVCSVGVACSASQQKVRAADAPTCTGGRTLVVHNGTRRTVEVVLGGGIPMGQVVDVPSPGQRSTALRLQGSVTSVSVRDQATKRLVEYADRGLRFEYGCQNHL